MVPGIDQQIGTHRIPGRDPGYTGRTATARRIARHALAEPAPDVGPAGIAGVMCGAHAQVLSAAEFSIARRLAGATRADGQRALWEERTLVKTFGPRGTIHLLSTADLPMWTGALSALQRRCRRIPEGVRFTPGQTDEIIAAIGQALANAGLTVDELTEAIGDPTGLWAVEPAMEAFGGRWPRRRQHRPGRSPTSAVRPLSRVRGQGEMPAATPASGAGTRSGRRAWPWRRASARRERRWRRSRPPRPCRRRTS